MSLSQIDLVEYQNRKISLLPILIAQQSVLLPLYFFIPNWLVGLNLLIAGVAYFQLIKKSAVVPKWLKVLLTLSAAAGVLLTFHRFAGRDAGVALISIMYGLKILEMHTQRDAYVLLLLGFFVLLAGFLFDQSPLIAIYQLIPVTAIFGALTSLHLVNTGASPNQVTQFSVLGRVAKYLLLALPIMLILFVFFPRLSGPIWKMPGSSSATSGVSDSMSPGAVSSLQLSEDVAFRVKFEGKEPAASNMYWRNLTLYDFDGFVWQRSRNKLPVVNFESGAHLEQDPKLTYRYEINLEPTKQNWLSLLDWPSQVPKSTRVYSDYSNQVPYKITNRIRYKAASNTGLKLEQLLPNESRSRNIQLPDRGNSRSREWAVNQRSKFKNDRQYIQSILQTINQQEYFYTLLPPIAEVDTVDSFWFDDKKGFCEHYSGTLVFLARAAGVPARVVVGYQGAEKNPLSDYWIVRYADAHAWTEIWFEDEGWVRVDPTTAIARHRVEEQLRSDYQHRTTLFDEFGFDAMNLEELGALKTLSYWFDQANTQWNNWVLDYGKGRQKDLFKGLGLSKLSTSQIAVLMISLLCVLLVWINWRWGRAREDRDPLEKSLEILVNKLEKSGVVIEPSTGLLWLAKELKSPNKSSFNLTDESLSKIESLLTHYVSLRYQTIDCSENKQKDFLRQVKTLKIRPLDYQ